MKLKKLQNTKPAIKYMGRSAKYFRDYIKSKMTVDMPFHNIHFDHIKPISAFNLKDEE